MLHDRLGLLLLSARRGTFMLNLVFKYSKRRENLDMYRPYIVYRLGGFHNIVF